MSESASGREGRGARMSKTLLSRLAMLEVLDASGPLTISELAQRCGMDVTVVSRTISACEPDGWVVRADHRVMIGPRATLLGNNGPIADLVARAGSLVHAVAGVTGLQAQAYALIGSHAVLIASAQGRIPGGLSGPLGLGAKAPVYALASGRAIAAQLDPAHLRSILPPEPFPDADALVAGLAGTPVEAMFGGPGGRNGKAGWKGNGNGSRRGRVSLPLTYAALEKVLDRVRATGLSTDAGLIDPAIHCIAVPWPQPTIAASLACLGPPDASFAEAALAPRALRLAAGPGASPQAILSVAAEAV